MTSFVTVNTTFHPGKIPSIIVELETIESESAYNVAEFIEREAKTLAPFRTGHLKDSIEISKGLLRSWVVKAGAHYAGYVEYGTQYMAPQPLFTPAVESARAYFVTDMTARLKKLGR